MSKLSRMVALALVVTGVPLGHAKAAEVPPPAPGDPAPVAADPVAAEPVAGDPVAADPAPPAPVASPIEIRNAPPPKPAFSGKGLLIGAYAVTGFSWVSRIIGLGLGLSAPASCTSAGDCDFSRIQASAAFTYMAPISQAIATGLVIPGALLKGRTDGWDYVTSGKPDRKGRSLLIAGAVIFGVFTATSVALRPAVLLGCLSNVRGCGGTGGYVGYMLGVQASDTLSTAGAGMMSYGIAYQNFRKTHAPKVAIAPWSNRGTYGLSLTGSF